MIRLAIETDIDEILKITNSCAQHMISKGIYQWNEHYPNESAFQNDVERKELYVLEFGNKVIGCITLSTHKDEEYIDVNWLSKSENCLYVHRLAIHPDFQSKGYAQYLMDYAEDFAKKQKFDSIRLDTFSQNKRNQHFYEQRSYIRLNDIYFPKQSEFPFHCYEKVL